MSYTIQHTGTATGWAWIDTPGREQIENMQDALVQAHRLAVSHGGIYSYRVVRHRGRYSFSIDAARVYGVFGPVARALS